MVSLECSATHGSQKLGSADQTGVPMVCTDVHVHVHVRVQRCAGALQCGDSEEFRHPHYGATPKGHI